MLQFTVDTVQSGEACQKCCCENLTLKPGTINRVVVGYAPWVLPIGRLHCEPSFTFEQMDTCSAPTQGNLPPQVQADIKLTTPIDTLLAADLNTYVSDLEDDPLTFKALPLYGPKHGKLTLLPAGTFDYTPHAGYKGEDRFYASASDGHTDPVVFEVMIAVGIATSAVLPTPSISIDRSGVQVDERYYTVSFPVKVSPAAQVCEVWRLTVLQGALDCSCVCYARTDCFDIRVIKC